VLNGGGELPAFPMRVACGHLAGSTLTGAALLEGLRDAAGVFYNNTHDRTCYNISQGVNPATSDDGELWSYQFCTEMFQPMSRDGVKDAFFEQQFDEASVVRASPSCAIVPPGRVSVSVCDTTHHPGL
jgi:lysosomal Pro-X carboxypeptidase